MSKTFKSEQKFNRQAAMEQGFYDGRFRNKVVADKKKKQDRQEARKFKHERYNWV